jgi:hypothetical protein
MEVCPSGHRRRRELYGRLRAEATAVAGDKQAQ